MAQQEVIPAVCYVLAETIHKHGGPLPFRSLPADLQDAGLLKVCRYHQLLELVFWYEPSCQSGFSASGTSFVVVPPPGWVPFSQMGCGSIADAIRKDTKSGDPRSGLHIALTHTGSIICEERRLSKVDDGPTGVASTNVMGTTSDAGDTEISLTVSEWRAYRQRQHAQESNPDPTPGQPGDKAAHHWLSLHGDEDGKKPVVLDTWTRYLRGARRKLHENNPRRGRPHGSSVVSSDHL